MDDTRKHDNKNKNKQNTKIMPVAINAGAGSFGMGSIVLFGAGLVTATLLSTLAFKTRTQRRSSSENRKTQSPSQETQTVNAPNHLESMIQSSQDSSADSLSLNLPNSSDEVTSMKEIQARKNQNLTLDEKQNTGFDIDEQVDSGDSNEDSIFSVVGEDKKNTLMCIDSVFEKLDDAYDEIVLECEEEQAVMLAHIESGPPTSEEDSSSEIIEREIGGEQKNLTLTDNELKEQVEKKLFISNEVVTSIEEYEAIKVGIQVVQSMPLGEDVAVEEDDEDVQTGHVAKGQDTVFMNAEAAYVNQIEVENNPQFQFLEEKQEDGHNGSVLENSEGVLTEIGYADQIVGELVIEEEAIDEVCVHQIEVEKGSRVQFVEEEKENDQLVQYESEQVTRYEEIKEALEDTLEVKDHEVALHVQQIHLNDSLNVSVHYQTAVEEDNPPTQLINEAERCKETEEMITENELVKKDEIPIGHTDGGLIDETGYRDQVVDELLVEEGGIDAACVHQIEEQDGPRVQFVEDEKENDQEIQHDSEQILVKEAIKATCGDLVNVEDIMVTTDHEGALDAHKMHLSEYPSSMISCSSVFKDSPNVFVDVKEVFPPTQLMNKEEHKETEDKLVMKKDEITHVQSIEEDDESEETELSSDVEESTPEKAKIGNHKIQENMEEKQTILSTNQNKDHKGIIKEDKGSESASRVLELAKGKKQALASEPWNLKLLTWYIMISIWFLCHWHFELPFPKVSLAGSFLVILILVGYQNRIKYKYK